MSTAGNTTAQSTTSIPEIDQFDETYSSLSLAQREAHFRSLVLHYKQSNSPATLTWFVEYVRRFPFNTQIWNMYAQHVKATQSLEAAQEIYKAAVRSNPKSYELWHCYVSFVRSEIQPQDEQTIIQLYEKALEQIGLDYCSSIYWEDIIRLLNDNKPAKLRYFQAALAVPTKNFDDLQEKFSEFFQYCTPEDLNACWESLYGREHAENMNGLSQSAIISTMQTSIQQIIQTTKAVHPKIVSFEEQLVNTEYSGSTTKDELEVWRKYIAFAKESLSSSHVLYLYEKALISNCDREELWTEYFEYLESLNAAVSSRGFSVWAKSGEFFSSWNNETVLFQIAELHELADEGVAARNVYSRLLERSKEQNFLRVLLRWVQFEKRVKSPVETIVVLLNSVFAENLSQPKRSGATLAWAAHEIARVHAKAGNRKQGLTGYIEFFQRNPVTRIGISQILAFVSEEFSNEATLADIIQDISAFGIENASAEEIDVIANLAVSQIRKEVQDVNKVRRLEQELRRIAAVTRQNKQNGQDQGLHKKRTLNELMGNLEHLATTKHAKYE